MTASYKSSRKEDVRRLFNRIVSTLERIGKRYALLQFPSSYRERSIDFVTVGGGTENAVIRVKVGSRVSREEAEDLVKASLAFDSVPIVVSDDPSLYDNIIYEKEGVYLMNERTLENMYTKPNEIIALYRKGDLYLVADKDVIRERRAQKNLSLGDVSYLTNISRKMIYMYEKEGGMVAVETAEKLVNVFGADAVKSVTFKVIKSDFLKKANRFIDKSGSSENVLKVIEREGEVYGLRKSAPDYIISGEEVVTVVDATSKEGFSLRKVVKKVTECVKLSEVAHTDVQVLVTSERLPTVKDELSTRIDLSKVILHKVRERELRSK